jgi:hypothetical protein
MTIDLILTKEVQQSIIATIKQCYPRQRTRHLFWFMSTRVYPYLSRMAGIEPPTLTTCWMRPEVTGEVNQMILFQCIACIGENLKDLHVNYESAPEYPLEWQWIDPRSWRVEKMQLSADRTALVVNESLTLAGIPVECFEYVLGNKSALEWIIDQYQVTTDNRSGIVNDPNREDDPEYIARLVCRIVYVSMETVRLQRQLVCLPMTMVAPSQIPPSFDVEKPTNQEAASTVDTSREATLWSEW